MASEKSVELHAESLARLREELGRRIVGQDDVVTQVLAAILAEGHCLIIGLPGLAKTLLVSSLAELLSLEFKRIQFTPDLMPSDITGATILSQESPGSRDFKFLAGPIFANVILADEINRTPPKTQAALMEAMEERQVSAGGRRLPLDRPFFVLATENPIEQQGTYPLPVSQLDRFLFNIIIDYPSSEEEFEILVRTTSTYQSSLAPVFTKEEVLELIAAARRIEVEPGLMEYASRIVRATRPLVSGAPAFTRENVAWGGGPRAAQSLIAAGRSFALLAGRSRLEHADIHRAALPGLRHRILLRYHAQAEGVRAEAVIENALALQPEGLYRPPEQSVPRAPKGLFARLRSALTR